MAWPLIAMLAVSAVSAAAKARADRKQKQDDNALSDEQHERGLRFEESQSNPYREQLAQGRSLGMLDMMKGSTYEPYSLGSGSYLDGAQPAGGFSYKADPRTSQAHSALYDSVLQGETPARSWMDPEGSELPPVSPSLLQGSGRAGVVERAAAGVAPGQRTAQPRRPVTRGGTDLLPLLMSMYGGGR